MRFELEAKLLAKHKSLSSKSLAIVFDWCEKNANPISEYYMNLCMACGGFDFSYFYRNSPNLLDQAYNSDNFAIIARDNFGREILKLIKNQQKNGNDNG